MIDYFELLSLVTKLNILISHPTDEGGWMVRYDIVFSDNNSGRAIALYNRLTNSKFDYYDPDTSYEEDVVAFVNAITESFKSLPQEFYTTT